MLSYLNGHILTEKKNLGIFYEKELQKTNQREFFNSWIAKKHIIKMSEYFPKPKQCGRKMKVELDLSNYTRKPDLKNATGVDTSDFAKIKCAKWFKQFKK